MATPQTVTQNMSIPQAFDVARHRHVAGELEQAWDIYSRILDVVPDHAEAAVMLASIAYRQAKTEDAGTYLDRAIGLNRAAIQRKADDDRSRASLVNLLLARGRIAEAEALVQELKLPLNPTRATPEEFDERRQAAIGRGLPLIIISTMPKSASESIWNKLAESLEMAQCYLSLGLFPDCCLIPARVDQAAAGGIIVKEHIGPSRHNLAALERTGVDRLIVHHRDPRQATLSWVHFARDDINQRLMAPLWRKIVPPAEVLDGDLSRQIDWCIDAYMPQLVEFLQDWRRVDADSGIPLSVLFMSFEIFRTEPAQYFEKVLDFYDIPRERFAAEAEAKVVHLRKGQLDEWRDVFSEAQRQRAWEMIPADMAEAFGWQP